MSLVVHVGFVVLVFFFLFRHRFLPRSPPVPWPANDEPGNSNGTRQCDRFKGPREFTENSIARKKNFFFQVSRTTTAVEMRSEKASSDPTLAHEPFSIGGSTAPQPLRKGVHAGFNRGVEGVYGQNFIFFKMSNVFQGATGVLQGAKGGPQGGGRERLRKAGPSQEKNKKKQKRTQQKRPRNRVRG